jgi:hypothetical protein
MVINGNTGVVSWSEPVAGVYQIYIRATNQLATAYTSYKLTVTGSYSCIAYTP